MGQMGMLLGEVNKLFVTHLHSDHVIGIPDLYLTGWASQGRTVPLRVWGPAGTHDMMAHLEKAFAFDIHVRRDVDELFPAEGIKTVATDIREGVVYNENGVRPRLVVFSHGGSPESLPLVRQHYDGPVEIGEDMMTIDVGESMTAHRFAAGPQ